MAIQGTDNASEALRVLRGKPMQREPARRSNKKWAGNLIHQHIDASISNVESAVLQIVGPPPVKPCRCCRNRHGPWARCIVSPEGCGNIISACANCHWYDKDKNCNFYKAPAPAPAPMNQPGKSWEKGHRHASSPFQGRLQHQERLTTIGMAAPRIMEHLHAAMADQRQEEAETRITVKIMETIINDPALDADERYIDLFRLFLSKWDILGLAVYWEIFVMRWLDCWL
ncbi:hypothetical protein N7509_013305 [Penicillium cosmopolitanum]|uniref:Uncharacterized protein n=1 Tax=Penicillium cosmopolitanum TaxID=1131564 RepID=A0A9W9VD70_9EURO|nr:uncharacterized protein N7509_013305 [Penicillium cosmopolitanum]KAJ5376419.1 hypothetical protein N7509_013305 [Penicillium cosmopolitanum]